MTPTSPAAKTAKLEQSLEQLKDSRSTKRRSGAKALRKLGDPSVGPALLEALRKEVEDPRTWETQYQLVMALAEVGHTPALPFLRELSQRNFKATMVYVALGDALVRLGRSETDDPAPLLEVLQRGRPELVDGALRAVAMLRLKLTPAAVDAVIRFASGCGLEDGLRFWPAAAAAGWSMPSVRPFLEECLTSPRDDLRQAAEASLAGRYLRWNPV